MSYPSDYEAKSGQWFILHEYRYTRSTQDAVLKGKLTGNVIQLPMPPSLNNNYNANWATTELGAFGNAVLNTNSFNGNLNSALDQFKQNKNASVWDAADSIASMLGSDAADLALAGVGDAITSSRLGQTAFGLGGVARNPFIATLYEGPDLRSFRFDYTFFPKSLQEAITLKEIETTLAKGMHPSFNAVFGNYLFDYPFMYKPEFSDASGLFKFKMCIIKNLSMQYHAGGVPIYFDANSSKIPSFITMGFEICENEVITQEWFS
jgi:hypothetical protein